MRVVSIFFVLILFLQTTYCQQKTVESDSLIALSQTGASPLFFAPFQYGLNAITVANYNEQK